VPDDLITPSDRGLFCEAGGFYIDPWRPVDRAVITHAHADHARPGSSRYLCAAAGEPLLARRLQPDARIEPLDFGTPITLHGVTISLHPAGHLLGSAQVRIEHRGRVAVVTGDYKTTPAGHAADPTCQPYEPLTCDQLVSECTFGLPIYRWADPATVFADMLRWWRSNAQRGRTSVIAAYALGKAQRVIAGLHALGEELPGSIAAHGAVLPFAELYRAQGVDLPEVLPVNKDTLPTIKGKGLVVAPPSALGSPWMRKLGDSASAMASGWMAVRGRRRHQGLDRGFVLSDHADWPGLLDAIDASGASRVGLTHGSTAALARYLREQRQLDACPIKTRFGGESEDEAQSNEAETSGGKGGREGET